MSKIMRELRAEGRATREAKDEYRQDGLRQHESIHIEPPEFLKKRIYDELCEHGVTLGGLCVLCPDSTAWSPFTLCHDEDFLS